MKKLITTLTLPATKAGKGILTKNKEPFYWVHKYFDDWDVQTVSKDTEALDVEVYELTEDATFEQMFKNLPMWETQEQIKAFVDKHKEYLSENLTFFPFESKEGNKLVARVDFCSGGLEVYVRHFSYDYVWDACLAVRIVVPATKTSNTLTLETAKECNECGGNGEHFMGVDAIKEYTETCHTCNSSGEQLRVEKLFTQHHQDLMSEVVEKLEEVKYPKDSTQGCNCNGYNNALTKAQTIIKSITPSHQVGWEVRENLTNNIKNK